MNMHVGDDASLRGQKRSVSLVAVGHAEGGLGQQPIKKRVRIGTLDAQDQSRRQAYGMGHDRAPVKVRDRSSSAWKWVSTWVG
jgi:hypothetical protein